jgi:hypothetical protein
MPTPSLLIVPARFKSGKLYSQVPTSGTGDFTVTRATTATRVNASGLIESVASGIPRLDYFASGGTVGCPALLVEPSGSNLAFNSQTWDATNNWQLTDGSGRVTVATATSGTLAPDGLSTANAISPTSGNIQHYLYSNATGTINYVSGTIYTLSAFFKKGSGDSGRYVQIAAKGGSAFVGNPYANFDLELGATLTVSGSVADSNRISRIQNYGNGWYRCSLTATCSVTVASTVGVIAVLLTADTNARIGAAFAGNTSDYIFGWGAQVETGSVATSYIPTTTASVTRNADVISVSGAVSGSIGQTEGTIYAEVAFSSALMSLPPPNRQILSLSADSSDENRVVIYMPDATNVTSGLAEIRGYIQTSNGLIFNAGSSALNLTSAKIAFAYKSGDYAIYFNGSIAASGTTAFAFGSALNKVNIGSRNNDINQLNNRIRAAALYTTRLTNTQLAALTTP